jgi:hypothetical protein
MRLGVVLLVVSAMMAFACGSGEDPKAPENGAPQPTFVAEGGTPEEQLRADVTNQLSSDAKVSFHTTLQGVDKDDIKADVTWYTDGQNQRQRFDFEGGEKLVGFQRASVFTLGDRGHIVICSAELPVDPHAASINAPGPKGACCEGSTSCGDIAGNAIFFLGFPLGYPKDPQKPFDPTGLDVAVERREIASVPARCYRFTTTGNESCFTAAGAEVYWKRNKSDYEGALEVKAFAIGTSVADDFNYPYPVYLDPNETLRTPTPSSR